MMAKSVDGSIDAKVVINIDMPEIGCLIWEEISGRKRPPGLTANEALSLLDGDDRNKIQKCALAVAKYMVEQAEKAVVTK
jgi:hypothetical protein